MVREGVEAALSDSIGARRENQANMVCVGVKRDYSELKDEK